MEAYDISREGIEWLSLHNVALRTAMSLAKQQGLDWTATLQLAVHILVMQNQKLQNTVANYEISKAFLELAMSPASESLAP
jgi:hypothetical protein